MSKAILVLDEMPEDCVRCKFAQWSVPDEKWVCIAKEEYGEPPWEIYDYDEALESPEPGPNPDWCPLQEMPERRFEENFDWTDLTQKENAAINHGWNKCMDKLEGVK